MINVVSDVVSSFYTTISIISHLIVFFLLTILLYLFGLCDVVDVFFSKAYFCALVFSSMSSFSSSVVCFFFCYRLFAFFFLIFSALISLPLTFQYCSVHWWIVGWISFRGSINYDNYVHFHDNYLNENTFSALEHYAIEIWYCKIRGLTDSTLNSFS